MGDLSDLPPAASACHPLHRHWHERGGAYHAAALHEQVCFAHHRRNDLFCAVWHSAGFAVCTGFYPVGTCCLSFVCAVLGTWVFVWFIQSIQFKDVVMVPLVGIMFSNIVMGVTNYLAYKYEMTQALSSCWSVIFHRHSWAV